ncbi:MAG: hypothetical protein V1668_03440 [Patescibacteria group bacterium]
MVNNLKNQISAGINVNKNVIDFIVNQIYKTEEYEGLSEEKRNRVVQMLTIIVRDSERHEMLLADLALKC